VEISSVRPEHWLRGALPFARLSLGIEDQFYLTLPFVLLAVNCRRHAAIIVPARS